MPEVIEISCNRPNHDFCILQVSVATVLRWVGQNYGHLRQISSRCCLPKMIKIGQCFTELFEKWKWHIFLETRLWH